MRANMNRRKFLGRVAASAAAFTIVPRHVMAGAGTVAPSEKITLAVIGTGTQGLREMTSLLPMPEIQVISICDPSRYAIGYRDWSANGLLNELRRLVGKSDWDAGTEGSIPGGRDVGKDLVETYYAGKRPSGTFKGCSAYADFRELLDKEKDLNAVKIMTPDHLHGVASIAAMKRGKHVMLHKPIANRLKEAKLVIDTARQRKVATYFLPWGANGSMDQVMAWIKEGAIGTLREVHNWTNRPVWPQYATIPTDTPPVPKGFDWDLWLGPERERPYHPNYTHMVFRGWYDFGGGTMADMGHYSLWAVFNALDLQAPTLIEPMLSHNCTFDGNVSTTVRNDFSFPTASAVRIRFPAKGQRPAVDLFWYDGGIRPVTPEELEVDGKEFAAEAMMFVGDKGKILAGFHVENPRLIPEKKVRGQETDTRQRRGRGEVPSGLRQWIAACRGEEQSPGSFLNAWPISEAINLWAVALRTGKKLQYDAESMTITNVPDANTYLAREYRKGWEPESV